MANLRIIGDNAADRAALSASSTNGSLAVTNLQSDKKSNVWQAVGTSARLGATWASPEAIQGAAAPFCNWSPTATWRVRLTSEPAATNLLLYSQLFSNAAWNGRWGGAATITQNDATYMAPDGTQTVAKVVATSGGAGVAQTIASLTAGVTYTLSCWVASTVSGFKLAVSGAAMGGATVPLAFPASSVLTRYSFTFTATVTGSLSVGVSDSVALQTFYCWGAQLEVGSVATSYYPTTTAAAARPLGYIDSWQAYTYDSGSVLACPALAITLRGWTAAQSANAYAYGGGACARLWLPSSIAAYGMVIDIVDANNLQGNLEAARLVCGPYWSPTYNTTTLSETYVDGTIHTRTDSGDLWSDASTIHKKVPIELEYMPATDRATLANILRASRAYPIFLSVFPGISDLELERAHTVYGKRMSDSEVAVQAAIMYGTKIEVESI